MLTNDTTKQAKLLKSPKLYTGSLDKTKVVGSAKSPQNRSMKPISHQDKSLHKIFSPPNSPKTDVQLFKNNNTAVKQSLAQKLITNKRAYSLNTCESSNMIKQKNPKENKTSIFKSYNSSKLDKENLRSKKDAIILETLETQSKTDAGELDPYRNDSPHNKKIDRFNQMFKSYISPDVLSRKMTHHSHILTASPLESPKNVMKTLEDLFIKTSSTHSIPWDKLKKPTDAQTVLDNYEFMLSRLEKDEIVKYNEIYFLSTIQNKVPAEDNTDLNDDNGDYKFIQGDHIIYQYELLDVLGKGSFGQVFKAFDHKNKVHVALKVINSRKKFHLQSKIEIKLLNHIKTHNGSDYNITMLKEHFMFREHMCLVFDLLDINLYEFLKANKFQGIHLNIIRKIAIQILYALKFLREHKIIHCDVKPENILLKNATRTGVRLIDFGSSCFESEKMYTYIQSRFYRSPEILLGTGYNTQADMWSFGCLLCELYLGHPLFAGETEQDQLLAIMEIFGYECLVCCLTCEKSPRKSTFFNEDLMPKIIANSHGRVRVPDTIPLASVIRCEDKNFLDLIQRCLKYDPEERSTPEAALTHSWILDDLPINLREQHIKLVDRALSNEEGSNAKETALMRQQQFKAYIPNQDHQTKHKSKALIGSIGIPIATISSDREAEKSEGSHRSKHQQDKPKIIYSHKSEKKNRNTSLNLDLTSGLEASIPTKTRQSKNLNLDVPNYGEEDFNFEARPQSVKNSNIIQSRSQQFTPSAKNSKMISLYRGLVQTDAPTREAENNKVYKASTSSPKMDLLNKFQARRHTLSHTDQKMSGGSKMSVKFLDKHKPSISSPKSSSNKLDYVNLRQPHTKS